MHPSFVFGLWLVCAIPGYHTRNPCMPPEVMQASASRGSDWPSAVALWVFFGTDF